jgi:hypothetical protein
MAGNRFRRVITLDNAGSALTDTLIAIPIDHRGIYNTDRKDKHTTRTFNDLRVYESDEVTPIAFYVEGVDTHSCSLFVRVNIPAGSSTFLIEYGNPEFDSLSDSSVIPAKITDQSTITHNWNASHLTSGAEVLEVEDGDPVMNWHNSETRAGSISDVFNEAFNSPVYDVDGANGHACITFNGTNHALATASVHHYAQTVSPQEISIYVVTKASTIAKYQSIYRNQVGSNFIIYQLFVAIIASTYLTAKLIAVPENA